MSPTNALAQADDDCDESCVELPEDARDEIETLCDEQLAAVLIELESGKPW